MCIKNLFILFLVLCLHAAHAQTCTNLGQNPGTAFPVCGSSTFAQNNVAICGQRPVPSQCSGSLFTDKNPYWYKFSCFSAGTLGFVITPNNLNDDYDWQIFDVTNRNPADVYTDGSMFVSCNWSGDGGRTGASSAGTLLVVCEGGGRPLFSRMANLIQGHNYLLLVSHFTDSQSGYSLSFGGGTASITDSTTGKLQSARISCDGLKINIQLSKKMKCNSLAANGSDFIISPASANVISAAGLNCGSGFDMDSLTVSLNNPLPPGNYTIAVKNGTDNNTLLDNCDAAIPVGNNVSFTVLSLQPTPMDSISPVGCAPDEIQLVFKKPILCSSVAADGSDFSLSPSTGINVVSASTACNNNITNIIKVKFSSPVYTSGTRGIILQRGNDGNTILDECLQETPAGSNVSFTTSDTVSADFNYKISYDCKADTLALTHNGNNSINQWTWTYSGGTSGLQHPVFIYTKFGVQQVRLIVSNGVCKDTSAISITLDNELKANFTGPDLLCPEDVANFRDTSIGNIVLWKWNFGNGNSSTAKNPPTQIYPTPNTSRIYAVKLIVQNNYNCFDTVTKQVKVLSNCYIAVATAFTPNGDGLNDYLYPINAFKAVNLTFVVYNRFGQLLFQTKDFTRKWDGTFNGAPQQPGTYVWTLQYTHRDTGQSFSLKGTSVLIR